MENFFYWCGWVVCIAGRWEATSLNRSVGCPVRESYNYHNTSGDLISPGDNRDTDAELWADNATSTVAENSNFNVRKNNLSSTLYHRMMAKKLMLNKQTAFNQSGDSNLVGNFLFIYLFISGFKIFEHKLKIF